MTQLEKPPYGSPCNSCGLCCRMEICPLGEIVFPGALAPCPALEADGDRQVCGLIAHPAAYAPLRSSIFGSDALRDAARYAVAAGVGCDTRGEDERNVPSIAARVRYSAAAARRVERLWSNARDEGR